MNPCTSTSGVHDAHKRVRYHQGMVLGVEDFDQQQAWIDGRLRWTARDALGYGVLRGLGVELQGAGADVEVRVRPGSAIDVCGRLVCVSQAQCARLADWFLTNTIADGDVDASSRTRLYVSLCYATCDTDPILAPGDPCRTDEETWVASRISDHFELKLTTTRPPTQEEAAVRRLGELFEAVQIVGAGGLNEADWLDAVKTACDDDTNVPPLSLDEDDAADRMRQALQWFATERRRQYVAGSADGTAACADTGSLGCCIPLGAIRAHVHKQSVNGAQRWILRTNAGDAPTVEDGSRVTLASLRTLQELVLARFGRRDGVIVAGRFLIEQSHVDEVQNGPKPAQLADPTVGQGAVVELLYAAKGTVLVGVRNLPRLATELLATVTPMSGPMTMPTLVDVMEVASLDDDDVRESPLAVWLAEVPDKTRALVLRFVPAFATSDNRAVSLPKGGPIRGFHLQLTSLGR